MTDSEEVEEWGLKFFILEIIAVFAIGLHENRPENSRLIGFFKNFYSISKYLKFKL
jgi:hypothetical protein